MQETLHFALHLKSSTRKMRLLVLLGVLGLKFILVTCSHDDSSNLKFIDSPGIIPECRPGLCSNGSDEAFAEKNDKSLVDHLTPCQFNSVVESKYLGNISLDADLYCSPKTLRVIPMLTCCSPQKPNSRFPVLYLFPVNGSFFTTKPIKLDWRKRSHRSKLPITDEIVILVHGWREQPMSKGSIWLYPALEAWTKVRQKPVIVVDWSWGNVQYFQTAANARAVGMAIGYALVNWNITNRTILTGFSMGGQIVGEAGKYTMKKRKPIKECVSIDPAGPGFDSGDPKMHISADDCALVQVIHSSSEVVPISLGPIIDQYGSFAHSGACDFWINCGRHQGSNCQNPTFGAMMENVPDSRFNDSLPGKCAHYRGAHIYVASVAKKCDFLGHECPDCDDFRFTEGCHVLLNGSTMSLPPYNNCKPKDRKDFYVKTVSNDYPYCPSTSL